MSGPRHTFSAAITGRMSPRAFTSAALNTAELYALIEAATWAPSAFNAQPWRFIVAPRTDTARHDALSAALMDGNGWAKQAGALIAVLAETRSAAHGKTPGEKVESKAYPYAMHDAALASAQLVLEAQNRGYHAHVMAGFDKEAVRAAFDVPARFEPLTVIAVGERGSPDTLPEALAARETAPRTRRAVTGNMWSRGPGTAQPAPGDALVDPEVVLDFWFGALDAQGMADAVHTARWFQKSPAFDRVIKTRFLPLYEAIVSDTLSGEVWQSPRGQLAQIVVLDQFARNMFRDTARMFAADDRALALGKAMHASGAAGTLAPAEQVFVHMPLMHAENLADQDACIAVFKTLAAAHDGPAGAMFATNVRYAEAHQAIIARFGRFPHRNRCVDRASTPEEAAFLQEPGSSF